MNIIEHEPLFNDLMPEQAAATQGGYNVSIYKEPNFGGSWLGSFNYGSSRVSSSASISSLMIYRGVWDFYDGFNYTGNRLTLRPGAYGDLGSFDNRIRSFRRRA